jgi:hypothetical protein
MPSFSEANCRSPLRSALTNIQNVYTLFHAVCLEWTRSPIRAETFAIMNSTMKAIELLGNIDDQHRLRAQVPKELPSGPVRLIVLLPEVDNADAAWANGIAREWSDELSDAQQDIYTLDDGQPVNAPR